MFEIFANTRRMIERDEAHLFGERKVEIEDTSVRAITSLIVDVPVRANVAPGMCAVYLLKFLIQGGVILAAKSTKGTNIITCGRPFFPLLDGVNGFTYSQLGEIS